MATPVSVPEDSPPPEADSWRKLALAMWRFFHSAYEYEAEMMTTDRSLGDRLRALLAAEDPNPPVFHVRPVFLTFSGKPYDDVARENHHVGKLEWRWVAVAADGKKLYGSTESYEHRDHAIEQAHSVADPMGAEVRIDPTDGE